MSPSCSSSSTVHGGCGGVVRLVSLLVLLPALLTYCHVRSISQRLELILVTTASTSDHFMNINKNNEATTTTTTTTTTTRIERNNGTTLLHSHHQKSLLLPFSSSSSRFDHSFCGIYSPVQHHGSSLLFARILPVASVSIASLSTILADNNFGKLELASGESAGLNLPVLQYQDAQRNCLTLTWQQQRQQLHRNPTKWCVQHHEDKVHANVNDGDDDVVRKRRYILVDSDNPSEMKRGDSSMMPFFLQVKPVVDVASSHRDNDSNGTLSFSSWWWPSRLFHWTRTILGLGPSDFRLNPNRYYQQQQQQASDGGSSRSSHHSHPLAEQVLHRPATTLLLILNIILAFVYWNQQVSPHAVSLNYTLMVQPQQHGGGGYCEWWRCWTGALAHFDLWHIGFNMMTLHALGKELEVRYGSIPFLFYNLSLMPMTSAIFIGIGYLQQKYQNRLPSSLSTGTSSTTTTTTTTTSSSSSSSSSSPLQSLLSLLSTAGHTVGYSGVLFAWLVVASLEQAQTCPISFLPHWCFQTHQVVSGFKVSAAPWVSLVVTQMMLPKRVSLVGHLSGILAGFLLHWNAFPLDLFQPSVLVPYALVIGQWWLLRKMIPIPPAAPPPCDTTMKNDHEMLLQDYHYDSEIVGGGGGAQQQQQRQQQQRRRRRHCTRHGDDDGNDGRSSITLRQDDQFYHRRLLLQLGRISMIGFLVGTMVMVTRRPWSSIILSYGACTFIFHMAICSHTRLCILSHSSLSSSSSSCCAEEKQRLTTLWRGFVVVSVLTVIVDSMTISGMMLLFGKAVTMSVSFLLLRVMGLLIILALACHSLKELDASSSSFNYNHNHGGGGGGIFAVTLGYAVLQPASALGQLLFLFVCSKRRAVLPFQGQGIVLGSTTTTISRMMTPGSDTRHQVSPLL